MLAFLFGPLYYIAKGMWKKGLSLLFLSTACTLVMVPFVPEPVLRGISFGFQALFAMNANVDYYRKKVLGEDFWW